MTAIIETKAYRSGRYAGRVVWRSRYRVTQTGTGFDLGWTLATNQQGRAIAYEDKESAERGARFLAERFCESLRQ